MTQIPIDYAFLDTVEAEIKAALEQVATLESGFETQAHNPDHGWRHSFSAMSRHLDSWSEQLGDLTRKTAAVEQELHEQEQAMREWFQSIEGARSKWRDLAATT